MKKIPSVIYVNNFKSSQAKRVCEYVFSDFLKSVKANIKEHCFYIEIYEKLTVYQKDKTKKDIYVHDYVDLDWFKKYWGSNWKLIYADKNQI